MPRLTLPVIASLALALLLGALLPLQSASAALPIDGFAPYQPQTKCSPSPKPGTLALEHYLLRRYKGTGSDGISRACSSGGTSEHKEGRAFDWRVSVHSARDRRYVKNFLTRLFATDAAGNQDALARRMGIMYIIWNDHIYASYRHFSKRAYKNAACKTVKNCSENLRHRTHMHISLSRPGAKGQTTWYVGRVKQTTPNPTPKPTPSPKPTPKPTPRPTPKPTPRPSGPAPLLDLQHQPYGRASVNGTGSVQRTGFALRAGTTYQVTVGGLFSYGSPHQVADAACVWSPASESWVPEPSATTTRSHGSLDLLVNGQPLFAGGCRDSHTYRAVVTPTRTGTLNLQVANRRAGGYGHLSVAVSAPGTDVTRALPSYPAIAAAPAADGTPVKGRGLLTESVSVSAGSANGVHTEHALEAGVQYRLTVTGEAGLGHGYSSNGQCVSAVGKWYRSASLDLRVPNADHGRLYVDGVPFDAAGSCSARSHTTEFTAARTGRLRLAVWDPVNPGDDSGALRVLVQRLTDIAGPGAARAEKPGWSDSWQQRNDWFDVDAGEADGTDSTMRVRAGERVTVFVRGTQHANGRNADASCVETRHGWMAKDPEVALGQDPLNMWVDGQAVDWRPYRQDGDCSTYYHAYVASFTATKSGPLRLAVFDLVHHDDKGTFQVGLFRG
jgi:hypothetical protein